MWSFALPGLALLLVNSGNLVFQMNSTGNMQFEDEEKFIFVVQPQSS